MGDWFFLIEVKNKRDCSQILDWAQNVEYDQQSDWGIHCTYGIITTMDLFFGEPDTSGEKHSYAVVESNGPDCMDHLWEYVDYPVYISIESSIIKIPGHEVLELGTLLETLPDL